MIPENWPRDKRGRILAHKGYPEGLRAYFTYWERRK